MLERSCYRTILQFLLSSESKDHLLLRCAPPHIAGCLPPHLQTGSPGVAQAFKRRVVGLPLLTPKQKLLGWSQKLSVLTSSPGVSYAHWGLITPNTRSYLVNLWWVGDANVKNVEPYSNLPLEKCYLTQSSASDSYLKYSNILRSLVRTWLCYTDWWYFISTLFTLVWTCRDQKFRSYLLHLPSLGPQELPFHNQKIPVSAWSLLLASPSLL